MKILEQNTFHQFFLSVPENMVQRTCIVQILVIISVFVLGSTLGLNLTLPGPLPGQHPDPEAVAREVHRYAFISTSTLFKVAYTYYIIMSMLTIHLIMSFIKLTPYIIPYLIFIIYTVILSYVIWQ